MVVKKDPAMPIRKHDNELKVHEKTVRTTIKQGLKWKSLARTLQHFLSTKMKEKWLKRCKNLKHFVKKIFLYFGFQIDGLHQAQNLTPLICLRRLLRKNVWRIYFEGMQIILKACWYNNWKKMMAILSKFTVLCQSSYFVVYFFLNQN